MQPENLSDQKLFKIYRDVLTPIRTPEGKLDWHYALRLKLLPEVNRRGRALLKANGWPERDDARYINIHTGGIESLYQVLHPWGMDKYENIYVVLEHWLPLEQVANPNLYKPKGKQLDLL